ncbi:MAG: Gfo/Idh/MocA family oxidoreductase [Candidatus Hydrogenedentes bacterium]|nr:Gfo/Idh/MocA family oxidoreductase [Candidatus Hydrogenedentota bacterium]
MNVNGLTRRDFLRGASAAAPLLLSPRAWGGNAPGSRVNLAIIGAGGRGNGLLNNTVHLPEARVVAVCDCFVARRETMRDQLDTFYGGKGVTAYADFREVLARDDIDGVIVATPDHWHVPIALAAARAGKAMYIEKPLGVSLAWAWQLREAVQARKNVFQYGTQQRSEAQFRQACELVRNGYLGAIERVEAWCPDMSSQYAAFSVPRYGSTEPAPVPDGFDYAQWLGPAPEKPYTVDRCTCYGAYHTYDYALGFIAGWGAHPLDIVQWGLGTDATSPVRYEGTGTIPTQGLYDTIDSWDVECAYASGVKLRFMGHRVAEAVVGAYRPWKDHGTTFFGSEGWVSVDRSGILASDPKLLAIALKETDTHLKAPQSHMHDFVTCVRSGDAPIAGLEAAIRSDTICHLSDMAIRLGRAVRWDPGTEQVRGDADATAMLTRPVRAPWDLSKPMLR